MTTMTRKTSSYSMWSSFADCERRAYWRYVRELVPVKVDEAMSFGKLIHECLAAWHETGNMLAVTSLIDMNYSLHQSAPEARKHWHYAHALMSAYMARYQHETLSVLAVEQQFNTRLVNPATGWPSRTFCLRGKIDMLVEESREWDKRIDNQHFVVEHKTTSALDAAYIEGLNLSLQADVYSFVHSKDSRQPVGVIYNVLQKPALRQYEVNKTRKEPEPDDEFRVRLCEALSAPGSFQRLTFFYDRQDQERLQAELWELSQRWLHCEKSKLWLQNRRACFTFRKPCPYFKLCASRDDEGILREFYVHEDAHIELNNEESNDATT